MTLPNANSPNSQELISDVVSNTEENLSYLEDIAGKTGYVVKFITPVRYQDVAVSSTETITGLGFQPRYILVFYVSDLGSGGFGFYTSTPTAANYARARTRGLNTATGFVTDRWLNYVNTTSLFNGIYDGYVNGMLGAVTATSSDGFTWQWYKNEGEVASEYCYAIAFCIK